MNQQQAIREAGKRIIPILQEFGIESAIVLGYMRIDESVERFVCAQMNNKDAAQADGLRQPLAFAAMWAGPDNPGLRPIEESPPAPQ